MREDVGDNLRMALSAWLATRLDASMEAQQRAPMVALALDIPVATNRVGGTFDAITKHLDQGDEDLLDVVHVTLGVLQRGDKTFAKPPHEEVDRLLALGRSVWMATEAGLVHRAEPTAQTAFNRAAAPADAASEELREAWAKAYNRNSDASDAWDHAIKTVELLYIPIVCPTKDKANLGSVAGDLKAQAGRFTFGLRSTGIGGVQTVESMIRLIWPNPDRHGNPHDRRMPTLQEARAVVNLAVTLVQWGRDGLLVRR